MITAPLLAITASVTYNSVFEDHPVPALILTVASWLTALAVLVWRWEVVGMRNREELDHGYTTVTMSFGGWLQDRPLSPGLFGLYIPWNYQGVWVLDGHTRQVISAPDPNYDAPGFYNDPTQVGFQRFWTGAVWTARTRNGHHFAPAPTSSN